MTDSARTIINLQHQHQQQQQQEIANYNNLGNNKSQQQHHQHQVEINIESNQNYQLYAELREQQLRARETGPRPMFEHLLFYLYF